MARLFSERVTVIFLVESRKRGPCANPIQLAYLSITVACHLYCNTIGFVVARPQEMLVAHPPLLAVPVTAAYLLADCIAINIFSRTHGLPMPSCPPEDARLLGCRLQAHGELPYGRCGVGGKTWRVCNRKDGTVHEPGNNMVHRRSWHAFLALARLEVGVWIAYLTLPPLPSPLLILILITPFCRVRHVAFWCILRRWFIHDKSKLFGGFPGSDRSSSCCTCWLKEVGHYFQDAGCFASFCA